MWYQLTVRLAGDGQNFELYGESIVGTTAGQHKAALPLGPIEVLVVMLEAVPAFRMRGRFVVCTRVILVLKHRISCSRTEETIAAALSSECVPCISMESVVVVAVSI